MISIRPLALGLALGLVVCGTASAQEMSRYRDYALESSVAAVRAQSGALAGETRTLHQRPATIQELKWRAPYITDTSKPVDPVRELAFTFYNDALYQIVVYYNRDRTEGLTNSDILDALSAIYGKPEIASPGTRTTTLVSSFPESVVVARWDSPESQVSLLRGSYAPEFRLVLISKALSARAANAIDEAARLNTLEAPQREAAQRQMEADDAQSALEKKRSDNKATFRP
jgi:hypothetical protein